MTKNYFQSKITMLSTVYGHKVPDTVLDNYWVLLKDLSSEIFDQMVNHILTTFIPSAQCPFPVPAHFAQLVEEFEAITLSKSIEQVKKAVSLFGAYESVTFDDMALHAVIMRYGGWSEICNWDEKQWLMKERDFLLAYKAARKCISGDEPKHLPGITEKENSLRGWNTFVPTPKKMINIKFSNFNQNKKIRKNEKNKLPNYVQCDIFEESV